uniref:Uncharacterized protein n=1 Tax=Oncorhynchus tshawytscha TaxID=74940 RepID=A0A8C8IZL9_ONCTS
MVRGDFQAAFDTCERGLESILNPEKKDSRWVLILRMCSAFMTWSLLHCIIGLTRCPHYECPEKIPAKIMQMWSKVAFTEDQKQTSQPQSCGGAAGLNTPQGAVIQKLEALLRLLNRGLSVASAGSFPIRRVFLAVVFLNMLFVWMDPAHPSSFPWISQMLQMLKQMWDAMFAPYYRA